MPWLSSILANLIALLQKVAAPVAAFFVGRSSKEKDILEKENEVLRKQRDNNVHSIDDANIVWRDWED